MVFKAVSIDQGPVVAFVLPLVSPLPNYASDSVKKVSEHYLRTALPEFCFRASHSSQYTILDEISDAAVALSEQNAPLELAQDDIFGQLASLQGLQGSSFLQEINAAKREKPLQTKHGPTVLQSVLPRRLLQLSQPRACLLLAEPILANSFGFSEPTNCMADFTTFYGSPLEAMALTDSTIDVLADKAASKLVFKPEYKTISTASAPAPAPTLASLGTLPRKPHIKLFTENNILLVDPMIITEKPSMQSCLEEVLELAAQVPLSKPDGFQSTNSVTEIRLSLLSLGTTEDNLDSKLWKPHPLSSAWNYGATQHHCCVLPTAITLTPDEADLQQKFAIRRLQIPLLDAAAADKDTNLPIEVPLLPELLAAAAPSLRVTLFQLPSFSGLQDPASYPETTVFTTNAKGLQGCTLLWDLVAHEMAPEGDAIMLPPVTMAGSQNGLSAAVSALLDHHRHADRGSSNSTAVLLSSQRGQVLPGLQAECNVAPQSLGSIALYLDWSLSTRNASLRTPDLILATNKSNNMIESVLEHKRFRNESVSAGKNHDNGGGVAAKVLSQILSPFAVGTASLTTRPSVSHMISESSVAVSDAKLAATPCNKLSRPDQQRLLPLKRPGKAPSGGGLGFFMKLQKDPKRPKNDGKEDSMLASENDFSDLVPAPASVQNILVELPHLHIELLRALKQTDAAILGSLNPQFLPTGVSSDDFPAVGGIAAVLRGLARLSSATGSAASEKPLLRSLGGAAVLRQTAELLIHHGIRSAAMYFENSARELPGLLSHGSGNGSGGGGALMQHMKKAEGLVEAGQVEDHPKHTALKHNLVTINALIPEAKILIIGDPKSFFTLYTVIHSTGMRPCHLDRDGQLAQALATATAAAVSPPLAEALDQACTVSDCVLASTELFLNTVAATHSTSGDFLLNRFRHVVVYTSEAAEQGKILQALHGGDVASRSVTFSIAAIKVNTPTLETEAALPVPAPPLPAVAAAIDAPVAAHVAQQSASVDWPLVISSTSSRPIQMLRSVYEAVLCLERQGAVVIERNLQILDLVLSPSAALILSPITEGQTFETFFGSISPILQRTSRAFTKIYLVCQISGDQVALQSQILRNMPQLMTAAAQCGVGLQCDVTTSTEETAALVQMIASLYLEEWKGSPVVQQYNVGDPPGSIETFLGAVPCLNPHSAAVLANCGLSLQELLNMKHDELQKVQNGLFGLIPRHSLELFAVCCAAGAPLGGGGNGATMPIPPQIQVPYMHHQHFVQPMERNGGMYADNRAVAEEQLLAAPQLPPSGPWGQQQAQQGFIPDSPLPNELVEPEDDEVVNGNAAAAAAGAMAVGRGMSPVFEGSMNSAPAPSWCGPQLGMPENYEHDFEGVDQMNSRAFAAAGGGGGGGDQKAGAFHLTGRDAGYAHYQQQQQRDPHMMQNARSYHMGSDFDRPRGGPILNDVHGQEAYQVDEFGVAIDPVGLWEAEEIASVHPGAATSAEDMRHHMYDQEVASGYRVPHQAQQGGRDPYDRVQYGNTMQYTNGGGGGGCLEESHGGGYAVNEFQLPVQTQRQQQGAYTRGNGGLTSYPNVSAVANMQYQNQHHMFPPAAPAVGMTGRMFGQRPSTVLPPPQHAQQQQRFPASRSHHFGSGSDDTQSSWQQPGAGGGARGYTAAALAQHAQQPQRSSSFWQAPSSQPGKPGGGADYLKRKWGGATRGKKGGVGKGGRGNKFSSRTKRQW